MTLLKLNDLHQIASLQDINAITDQISLVKNQSFTIHYLGLGYIKSLYDNVVAKYPNITFICDVDDDGAAAQDSLSMGFKHIVFTGNEAVKIKLKSIATKYNATII